MAHEAEDCKVSAQPGADAAIVEWYHENGSWVCKYVKEAKDLIEEYNESVEAYNIAKKEQNLAIGDQQLLDPLEDPDTTDLWLKIISEYSSFEEHDETAVTAADAKGFKNKLGSNYEIAMKVKAAGEKAEAEQFLGGWVPFTNKPVYDLYKEVLIDQSIRVGSAWTRTKSAYHGDNIAAKIQAVANNLKQFHDDLLLVAEPAAIGWEGAESMELGENAFGESFGARRDEMSPIEQAMAAGAHGGMSAEDIAILKADLEKKRDDELALVTLYDPDNSGAPTLVLKEQCFLLNHITELLQYKKKIEILSPKGLPYWPHAGFGNASLMVDGDPYGFINKLTQHQAQGAFFNMKTEELSSLQPRIRLYKVVYDPDDPNVETQQEFNFDSYATEKDVENLFKTTTKRGFGVGIKNFSFTYDGNNPFAAKKSIKASLTIFASSFDELLVDRGGYMYADLALKTGKTKKKPDTDTSQQCEDLTNLEMERNLAKLNFRLKAVVGWARPSGNTDIFTSRTEKGKQSILNAINDSYITLNLTPTIHEFKIDDMGRVNFVINYLAYIEDFFDQPQFDIFYNKDVNKRILEREFKYKELSKKCSASELGEWKKELASTGEIREDKFKNVQSLMNRMRKNRKIRYINISADQIPALMKDGPFWEQGGVQVTGAEMNHQQLNELSAQTYTSVFDPDDNEQERTKREEYFRKRQLKIQERAENRAASEGGPTQNISFFYVSDLIDIILLSIEKRLEDFSDDTLWKTPKKIRSTGTFSPWRDKLPPGEESSTPAEPGFIEYPTSDLALPGEYPTSDPETEPDEGTRRDWEGNAEMYRKFHQQFKKFRVMLGPTEIVDSKNNSKKMHVSLGDLPISTKYFMEWLSEKTLKREDLRYNLNKFLNDFFNNLIRNFLNKDDCFDFNTKQKTRLNQAAITSYKNGVGSYDEITTAIAAREYTTRASRIDIKDLPGPALNVSGPQGVSVSDTGVRNEMNYLVYFAGRTQPIEFMNGNRREDEERGIFHYIIGKSSGLVKNIELTKTDARYLKEVRFQQEGFDGLEQLREVYDVNIDCYSNIKTFPGTYIYVDPRGFAPNTQAFGKLTKKGEKTYRHVMDLTRYGIGGYCMIIRSEHNFGPGLADTKITAKWVAQIEHEEDERQCEARKENSGGDGTSTNCDVIPEEETTWRDSSLMQWATSLPYVGALEGPQGTGYKTTGGRAGLNQALIDLKKGK